MDRIKIRDLESLIVDLLKLADSVGKMIKEDGLPQNSINIKNIACKIEESSHEEYRVARELGKKTFYIPDFLKSSDEYFLIGNGSGEYFKILIMWMQGTGKKRSKG